MVATNALELGIDIGRLDAAVLAGYPGKVASARQQMGRAGRRQGASVGVLVAGARPWINASSPIPNGCSSAARNTPGLKPDNGIILAGDLDFAAAELPIRAGEGGAGMLPSGGRLLDDLVAAGQLYRGGSVTFGPVTAAPPAAMSLRAAAPDRIVIQTAEPRRKAAGDQRGR